MVVANNDWCIEPVQHQCKIMPAVFYGRDEMQAYSNAKCDQQHYDGQNDRVCLSRLSRTGTRR